ncbi:MAG: hypothetical protein JEZ09_16140 [Salinivirgaceae bacterium]|nr:hypothetical protein [Salinivirgaceae bacterium]
MVKKNKKNIQQFQEALLSNTGFIKHESNEPSNKSESPSLIEDAILKKLELLAEFENIEISELINKALNHFLRLKGLQLEQAKKARDEKNS